MDESYTKYSAQGQSNSHIALARYGRLVKGTASAVP